MFLGYQQDLEGAIGPKGLSKESLIGLSGSLGEYLRELQRSRESNENKILALVDKTDDLEEILTTAIRISDGAETVVILGTGGSSLGGQTLVRLADLGFGPKPGRPRIIFFDNIDPVTFGSFFHTSNPQKTRFIAISKSGETAETILQTELCLSWIKASGGPLPKDVFTIITEEKPSTLTQIAMAHDIPRIVHCPKIGGRYSSFSNVGLLPAAIAGLDISAIRLAGAAAMDASLKASPDKSPAALGAALNIGLSQQKGIRTSVLMPYVDSLRPFTFWYRQIWAESLGKDGKGTLPVSAMGTVDQHSQLQLYLDGPPDKLFTLILIKNIDSSRLPAVTGEVDLGYLNGKSLGDLLDASQRATAETLVRNGRPTRVFRIARVDEEAIGALMAHYQLETILAARLLGVNPFDQPAVEQGKRLSREYLADKETP